MEQSCYRDCSSLTGLSIKTDNGDTSHGANKSGIYVTTTDCRQIKGKKKSVLMMPCRIFCYHGYGPIAPLEQRIT